MNRSSELPQYYLSSLQYSWHVRYSWLEWCKSIPVTELNKSRTGGQGSILETLLHIIDVENSWINAIRGKNDVPLTIQDYNTLASVEEISTQTMEMADTFIREELPHLQIDKEINVSWDDSKYSVDSILHHIIFHSVHHMGQLSIWARQMNRAPVAISYLSSEVELKGE
ncbi:hypothetical protein GZ22_12645 [Terribacillus saccharophilus]|uniref:Damage-inducible protein DinB n=1 Tax=Terribacillus saccharophilus TaxID=361277 RepID=A0A075LN35_9BACI|nr:DinB family protein [Terribacillus goriensis]AIF67402.1 hypothetical protein GZ22_12645 [Terribacillus goriensis]